MTPPALLDAYCAAGGCSDGYARAGFAPYGVDTDPAALRHYPYPHHAGDALEVLRDDAFLDRFAVIHASPPCHGYSRTRALADAGGWNARATPYDDLVGPTRDLLERWAARTGGVWVIENVPGAPMGDAVVFCGRAFGLDVKRHRLFESNALLLSPGCACDSTTPVGVWGRPGDHVPSGGTTARDLAHGLEAMGQPPGRMPWKFLALSIPPAYTEAIGTQLLAHVGAPA